jgi:protein-S-isoprenylcysteine O-methyltransferase Ste14
MRGEAEQREAGMDAGAREENKPCERPTLIFQIGKFKLTGWRAGAVLGAIIGAMAGAILARKSPMADLRHFFVHNWAMILSFVLWMAFSVYWGAAAKNSAATKSSESRKSMMVRQVMLNVALLLLFVPVPRLMWQFRPDAFAFVPIGLAVQAAFFWLAAWARRHLGRNWSAEVRVAQGHELVKTGPYRMVRHPIYTAMLGMFIGTAIVSGRLHALAGVALLAVAYFRKIRMEEQRMSEEFGAAYGEYRKKSWARVPWVL